MRVVELVDKFLKSMFVPFYLLDKSLFYLFIRLLYVDFHLIYLLGLVLRLSNDALELTDSDLEVVHRLVAVQ